jgi:hypothetical protein
VRARPKRNRVVERIRIRVVEFILDNWEEGGKIGKSFLSEF